MNRNFKKCMSAALAAAVIAAAAVLPVSAAEETIMSYNGGVLTVTADKAYTGAKLMVASYNADKTLGSLNLLEQELAAGENTISIAAEPGDRIMLWSGFGGVMDPICASVTVQESIPENAVLFDFGTEDNAADGYYNVTRDTAYATNKSGDIQYGLLGADGNGNKVSGRTDSFDMQEGQNIELISGAKDEVSGANDDWIGVTDGMYPIRFAMNTTNNTYYEVTAVLTGADQSIPAEVSLYSEKRHPIIMNEIINPGETKTVKFTATVQNVYYQKSDPNGTYVDDQLNVVVSGDNAAIASLMAVPVEHKTTIWAYTDSTGCDQGSALPFFGLQNYAGVAQFLSKYLPEGIAISNQGEGGLNAADNLHWNCANANIRAGDYVYVEYGHNHKDDGVNGYLAAIPKYYEKAHAVGAYTIYVGPIDRHNANQYDASTNTWSSTLSGFSDAAKAYVEELIANGAEDVAFIDLNEPSLRWMESVCEEVKEIRGADVYEANATDYYFQGVKGGNIDGTHPNDAGADNLASLFFEQAVKAVNAGDAEGASSSEKIQADVLRPLVTGMRTAEPYKVPAEVILAGKAPNSAYPDVYTPPNLPQYPNVIKNITITGGAVVSADVLVQKAEITMDAYGILVITVSDENGVEKGKIYAVEQVDNSTGEGTQTITSFRNDSSITIEDTDTISAVVWKAVDSGDGLAVDPENIAYSAVYVPSEIEAELITDEDGNDGEDFEFYGYTAGDSINGLNGWSAAGSAGRVTEIGTDADTGLNYVNIQSDGMKDNVANQGSFYLVKKLESAIGTTGKYAVDMDIRYNSMGNNGTYYFNVQLIDGYDASRTPWGTQALTLYTMRNGGGIYADGTEAGALNSGQWTNVRYILDMDMGKAYVSVAGGDAVEITVPNYDTTSTVISPTQSTYLSFNLNRNTVDIDVANLHVQKLKSTKLPDKTITVASDNTTMGTASISGVSDSTYTAAMNTAVTVKAEANEGYEFVEWQNADGTNYSYNAEETIRLHKDMNLKAIFKVAETDPITYLYKQDFSKLSTETIAADGWNSPNAQDAVTVATDTTDGIGNYLKYGKNDNSRGATKSFGTTYTDESGLVFSANIKFNKANTDPNQFTVHGGNIVYSNNNVNYGCTGGYIIDIQETKAGAITVNGNETTAPDNTWLAVTGVCDFTNHTVAVTITSLDGETKYYNGTVNMADTAATGIAGLYFKFGRSAYGVVSFDNIKVYAASELNK